MVGGTAVVGVAVVVIRIVVVVGLVLGGSAPGVPTLVGGPVLVDATVVATSAPSWAEVVAPGGSANNSPATSPG